MPEELPLEQKIYDILFELNPLNYSTNTTKNLIYTDNSKDFKDYLNSSENAEQIQKKNL